MFYNHHTRMTSSRGEVPKSANIQLYPVWTDYVGHSSITNMLHGPMYSYNATRAYVRLH
jgi:hypothetical protein